MGRARRYVLGTVDTSLQSELVPQLTCSVDYILFIKANVDLDVNVNEVQATQYVSADKLKVLFDDPSLKFTPWFKLICNSMLFEWWESLDSGLDKYMNEQEIRRML